MRNYRHQNLWDGCVGAWCPSQDNSRSLRLTDHSGYNNHGTLASGMDPATDWVASDGKVALDFDIIAGSVRADGAALLMRSAPQFSVSLWAAANAYAGNPSLFSLSPSTFSGADHFDFYPYDDSAGNGIRVYFAGSSILNQNSASLADGRMHHFCFVSRSPTNHEVFADGFSIGVSSSTASLTANITRLYMGNAVYGAPVAAKVDDYRIYNRALTASEVQTLALRRGIAYETKRNRSPRRALTVVPETTKRYAGSRRPARVNNTLWDGCVGAWCPSQDNSRSTRLTDHSGYNNHGTLTLMDPATDWVASEGKVALSFDGTDGYVTGSTGTTTESLWSVSAWVRLPIFPGTQFSIFNIGSSPDRNMSLDIDGSNVPRLYFTNTGGGYIGFNSTIALSLFRWTHIAGTYDKVTMRLFVNGVAGGTRAATDTVKDGPDLFYIGSLNGTNAMLTGQLDDIRIYNRALTPSEIQTLALRRGIAYETKRNRSPRLAATAPAINRRRNMMMGCSF